MAGIDSLGGSVQAVAVVVWAQSMLSVWEMVSTAESAGGGDKCQPGGESRRLELWEASTRAVFITRHYRSRA